MPRRELLLIGEMIDAAEEAQRLVVGRDVDDIQADRQVRDALLWNFTVLGEAAAQLPDEFKMTYGPYPRILDTGCDYAAVGSVAARRAS